MDTDHNRRDHNGNTDHRTLKVEQGPTGGRRITSDFGLDPEGYPVMPPAPHYDRGGEDR